jgi:hypothetical protein
MARNFRYFGFAMRKQLRDHSFHIRANAVALLRPLNECFIHVLP